MSLEALEFLETNELKAEVQQYIQNAQLNGVAGVYVSVLVCERTLMRIVRPYTLINKKYALTGAQPTSSFLRIFNEIAKGQRK